MNKKMSKTIEEYMANNGWSSSEFLGHAKVLFPELANSGVQFKVGRTVIHGFTETRTIKFYVHHNGRTKEYLTITDVNGNEIFNYHCSESVEKILADVKQYLVI